MHSHVVEFNNHRNLEANEFGQWNSMESSTRQRPVSLLYDIYPIINSINAIRIANFGPEFEIRLSD